MNDHCNISHPLQREGTYQWQRLQEGLKKDFYKPDDRSIEQMVKQIAQYASFVKYYDRNLNHWGQWEAFFEYLYDYQKKKLKFEQIDNLLQKGDVPPHIGLLLSFLKTFQSTRDQFNNFTNRHLDFYYKDVLQLQPKTSVADKVAVVFEPEKNTIQAKVEAGREMNAGKDATGKNLVYKTMREIIVNQVIIAQKKTIYANKSVKGNLLGLHIAKNAAVENMFTQNNISSWSPFGALANPLAEIGFAVSSPMLFANEGRRRLSIEIDGAASLPRASLTAYFTGPKGWVSAEVDIKPGVDLNSSSVSKRFLLVKIDESLPAISAYDEKTHKSGFSCSYPVVKLLLKNDNTFSTAYDFFTALKVSSIKKMVMNVEGAKSFTVIGDTGRLNPLQPFKPFGSTPTKNKSIFTIGSNEAFNKYLQSFHLAINWKGAPGNVFKYYKPYDDFLINRMKEKKVGTFQKESYTAFRAPLINFNQGNVPGKVELMNGGKWVPVAEDIPNHYTARSANTYNTFHVVNKIKDEYDVTNSNDFSNESRYGFARVTLSYDFGHSLFPSVLSDVIMQNALAKKADELLSIPQQPYTPEFNSLHLDYVLEDTIDINSNPEHKFIQLHPFGFSNITTAQQPLINSEYNKHGQLYIGMSGCNVPQIINLFFARLDGTENIDAETKEKPEYYYLSANTWVKFKYEEIVIDTTHAFTSSGFISFSIPKEALDTNTLMGESLVWIKVVSATSADAYPSVIDIHTNAVEAEFQDKENDPFHLQWPLASGTITKPSIKIEGVKKVAQPYASYGGKMNEQEEQFNIRTSERLRHKNRSWSIWDYEHLLLEKFPSIYKVKCISHARKNNMFAPGYVLCVVLPAIVNIADKDLLQPRLSKALLTEAIEYLSQFKTTFSNVELINPVYEEITVKCSVRIRKGFDENYYSVQLNKDLQQYISPWIMNKNISPSFGGKIYASGIINFIEELDYVDYLTNFEATKLENNKLVTWKENTMGSSEEVILTSAAQHQIDTNAIC